MIVLNKKRYIWFFITRKSDKYQEAIAMTGFSKQYSACSKSINLSLGENKLEIGQLDVCYVHISIIQTPNAKRMDRR